MMEKARRLRDLEGSPKVVIQDPNLFFRDAQAEYPDAPVWTGELYLELHRATYTSQARTKSGNRRSEHLLREAELWAATAALRAGHPYPYEDLDRLWKTVLLHQFHDILPGSSIAWVHREAEATYARVKEELEGIIGDAARVLSGTAEAQPTAWVLNAGPRARTEVVAVPAELASPGGVGQPLANGSVAVYATVPASGAAPLITAQPLLPVTVTDRVLDNGLVRVTLDDDGLFASVRDLEADREVLAPGERGNLLRLHTDLPNEWDAWDIDRHYKRQYTDLTAVDSITVAESGPLLGAIRVTRSFGESTITQIIRLRAGSPGSTSRPRSTGTRRRRSSKRPSRSTCTPTARPPRSSSATCSARRTPTPAGRRPASRSSATAGCTWRRPATGWRSSTTRRTAMT